MGKYTIKDISFSEKQFIIIINDCNTIKNEIIETTDLFIL
jgi:hypothetical protein